MFSLLLKKALPFTLTLVVGTIVGGLFNSRRAAAPGWSWAGPENAAPLPFGDTYGHGRACRMSRRYLVAESRPLVILFKPDAHLPYSYKDYGNSAWVRVTFGADGKVQKVEPAGRSFGWYKPADLPPVFDAVESAARQIQFSPETINGVPVSVEKEVEIHFFGDGQQ